MRLIIILLFISQFQSLYAQKIEGVVYDEETRKPLKDAKLLLSNNKLNQTLEVTSDAAGNVVFLISDFCNLDSLINIRVSRKNYLTTFFVINCKSQNGYQDFKIQNVSSRCRFDTAYIIYNIGQVETNCDELDKLIDLAKSLKEELSATIVLNFYYSPKEKDGYQISLQRANYISGFISKYGGLSENYTIRVLKGENSILKLSAVPK